MPPFYLDIWRNWQQNALSNSCLCTLKTILLYCFIVLLCICVVSCPYVIYYPTVMARYSLFVLKVLLNPKQTNKLTHFDLIPPTVNLPWQKKYISIVIVVINMYKLDLELQNGMVDNEGSTCYNIYVNLLSDVWVTLTLGKRRWGIRHRRRRP